MTQVLHNGVPNRIEEAKKLQVDRTARSDYSIPRLFLSWTFLSNYRIDNLIIFTQKL